MNLTVEPVSSEHAEEKSALASRFTSQGEAPGGSMQEVTLNFTSWVADVTVRE